MTCCIFTCFALFALSTGYCAVKSIQSFKDTAEQQKKWLLVWTAIAIIFLLEHLLVFLPLIPGYYLLRTLFIVWLYHEKFNGALLLFDLAKPFLPFVDVAMQYLKHADLSKFMPKTSE